MAFSLFNKARPVTGEAILTGNGVSHEAGAAFRIGVYQFRVRAVSPVRRREALGEDSVQRMVDSRIDTTIVLSGYVLDGGLTGINNLASQINADGSAARTITLKHVTGGTISGPCLIDLLEVSGDGRGDELGITLRANLTNTNSPEA